MSAEKRKSVSADPAVLLHAADKFLHKMVVMASAMLDVDHSLFFSIDPTSGDLTITHSNNGQGVGLSSSSGLGVEGYCAQHKHALVINDSCCDSRVGSSALSAIHKLNNVMCFPLFDVGGNTMGVLMAANKMSLTEPMTCLPFHSRDEEVMLNIATTGSLAFRCYNDFVMGRAPESSINAVHRLLCHACAQVESVDSFSDHLEVKSIKSAHPSREAMNLDINIESGGKGISPLRDHFSSPPSVSRTRFLRGFSARSIGSFGGMEVEEDYLESFASHDDDFSPASANLPVTVPSAQTPRKSLVASRTGSQLRLITRSEPGSSFEKTLGKFGDMYFSLLSSTSMKHLLDEAQNIAKEFLGAHHAYVCSVSAENGGSLIVSSPTGDTIMNLYDLPKEFITSLDWGMVNEIISLSRGRFPNPSNHSLKESLSSVLPGVKGSSALIVPLRSPQEYETTEVDELRSSEMSRLLLLTKDSDRFSAFEKDSVGLFAKILSEAASHVSFIDSRGSGVALPKKAPLLKGNISYLSNPFVLLISFDGNFIVSSRNLSDVFGLHGCVGHFTDWIASKNDQLLRDIARAIEQERGTVREDYLLSSAAKEGAGVVFDYSVLPLIDTYYSCSCAKCMSTSPVRTMLSHSGSSTLSATTPLPPASSSFVCQRKFQGSSFIMITAKSSSRSMSEFRAFCRTPSSNPAGWFDDVEGTSRVSEGEKSNAIHKLRQSRSRPTESALGVGGSTTEGNRRERSHSEIGDEEIIELGSDSSSCIQLRHRMSFPRSMGSPSTYTLATSAESICTWDFNVLDIKETPLLRRVIYQIFAMAVNFDDIGVDANVLHDYVKEASGHYRDVIFHNFYHATCITHVTFLLTRETSDVIVLPKALHFGLLLSALVHDIQHPGNTNLFEINSKSELAIMYNDQSVLENHHCATAFRLMARPGLNVLGGMKTDDQREVRRLMVGAIMATDMSKHADLMEETLVRANHASTWNPNELTEQIFYAKITLHAADLSNPTRHFPVAFEWAKRIAAEFNEQTKVEAASGLPVLSFMVSTDELAIVKNELSFSTYVVAPMWRGLAKLFPQYNFLLDILSDNANEYGEKVTVLSPSVPGETEKK